jgi:septal ring factor EnvC (AmiA/AmiB activator)
LAQVDQTEKELQQETVVKAELRKKSQDERLQLHQATDARKKLLSSWDEELKSQAVRIRELKEDEERLANLVDSFSKSTEPDVSASVSTEQGAKRGRCPPAGIVVARFGSKRLNGHWDGVLIGGREGTPVKAVAGGRVAFADWFRGYGLLTIIDHGAGVMSLYAFNQSLSKSKGDEVAADEVIATLGASGGRDKPGLYFGIRNQGKPVDPIAWCKAQL